MAVMVILTGEEGGVRICYHNCYGRVLLYNKKNGLDLND
jgi:hypothetical protein